jgi:hypothetical protein
MCMSAQFRCLLVSRARCFSRGCLQELESREDAIRSKEDAGIKQDQLLRQLKIEARYRPLTHY